MSEPRSRSRRATPGWSAAAVVVVLGLGAAVALWVNRGSDQGEACAVPTAVELVELAAQSQAVVRAVVEGSAELDDGTTQAIGWRMKVDELSAGEGDAPAVGDVVAVWPNLWDGELPDGERVVAYLGTHPDVTRADGVTLPAFQSLGLLVDNGDDTVSRLCKDSRSEPVDRAVSGS